MKRNNKALYEQIMRNVSREVKRTLNENLENNEIIKKLCSCFNQLYVTYNIDISSPEFKEYIDSALSISINQIKQLQ